MHPYRGWPFLAAPHHPLLSALWEIFAHGSLGVAAVAPLLWSSSRRFRAAILAFVGGVALDIDHVFAAGSLDPRDLEALGHRPATHSLLFATLLALGMLLLSRRPVLAWCTFAVLLAHLLFDAAGGGVRLLFPLRRPDAIPWLACPLGLALLIALSAKLGSAERGREKFASSAFSAG